MNLLGGESIKKRYEQKNRKKTKKSKENGAVAPSDKTTQAQKVLGEAKKEMVEGGGENSQ